MRPSSVRLLFFFLSFATFFIVIESRAQVPSWDSGTPLLRKEVRGFGLGVNLDRQATVYYAIYRVEINDPGPGALTGAQIRDNTGPASGRVANGSFAFGDASYCRTPGVTSCVSGPETLITRYYSLDVSRVGAPAPFTYRVYYVAENSSGFSTVVDRSDVTLSGTTRCLAVGSATTGPANGNFLAALSDRCSPSQYLLDVTYTGVDYASGTPVVAVVNFGEAGSTGTDYTLALQNSALGTPEMNKAFRRYFVQIPHTYDYSLGHNPALNAPGSGCTFHVDINLATCSGFNTEQDIDITVWDKPNTVRGLQDVQPNGLNSDDGGVDDEEYEVCAGDRTPINLVDASVFNCTTVEEARESLGLNAARNREARWVQWVYGATGTTVTTSAAANDKVTINGVDFNATDLPIYGPIQYLAANVDDPASTAFPVRMPINSAAGDVLMVEMRSWNTCLPYDNNVGNGGLNPAGGVFDVGPNLDAKWFNAAGLYNQAGAGTAFADANTAPIVFQKPIVAVGAPAPPTFSPNPYVICEELADPAYEITLASPVGTPTFRVYSDAGLAVLERTDNAGPYTYDPANDGPNAINEDNPGTYTRYATVSSGVCTSLPVTIPIVIEEKVTPGVIAHAGPLTVCTGTDPAAFTSTTGASGGRDGTPTYQWQSATAAAGPWNNIAGATSETYNPGAIVTGDPRFFRRLAISDNGGVGGVCASAASNVITFVINTPVAGGQIGGDQTVCSGVTNPSLLTNDVAGSGGSGTPSYTWQISTDNFGADINTIAGATSATYDPPSPLTVTTYYRRVNTSGVCVPTAAFSDVAIITVDAAVNPGTIGTAQTICAGGDPALLTSSTNASGGNGTSWTYQWEQSTTSAVAGFTDIGGATLSTFDPPVLTQTTWYRRRASSGQCSATSTAAIEITVNALPTAVISGGGSICQGTPAPDVVFSFTGTGPWTLTYAMDGVPQAPVLVNTSPYNLTDPDGDASADGILYTIVSISDANTPTCTVTTPHANIDNTANVAVRDIATPPPTVDSFTGGMAVCDAGGATNPPDAVLNLAPNSVQTYNVGYRLRRISTNTLGAVIGPANFVSNAAGEITISPTYTQMGNAPDPQGYEIIIVSIFNVSTGCAGAVPIVGPTLVVNPVPIIANATKTICSGASVNHEIVLTPANFPSGTTFTWAAPTMSAGAAQGTAGAAVPMGVAGTIHINDILTNTSGSPITATYTITPTSGAGCAGTARTLTVTVNPASVITAGQTKTICSGQAVNKEILLTPANLPVGTRFSWPAPTMSAGPAQGTGQTNIPMGAAGTSHITDVLTNTTGAPITATYTVTPSTTPAGCSGAAVNIVITIDPAPVIVAGQTKTICSGDAVNHEILLNPLNLPADTRFSWPAPTMSAGGPQGSAQTNVPMGAAGTFHITDVLTNTTGAPITATYNVTPSTVAGCLGTARTVVVTVNPAPSLALAQTATICSGENVGYHILLNPLNLPAGTTFDWSPPAMSDGSTQGTAGVGVAMGGAGTLHINDVLTNTSAAPITATYSVTPTSADGCVGAPRDIAVTVNPLPTANAIIGQGTVCAGPNIILYQVTPRAGSTYAWNIPAQFDVFGGGGVNDFFVLLSFPTVDAGSAISVVETNSFGCTGPTNSLTITVASAPGALTIDGSLLVCKGQQGAVYEIPVGIFNPASTYTWSASGANIVSATSGVGLRQITVDFGLLASATITVNETSVSGCAGTPETITVNAAERPSVTSANNQAICSGSAPTLNFTSSLGVGTTTFNWKVTNITGAVTGTALNAAGTGNLNQVLTNTSGFAGTVTYEVTPVGIAAPNCSGTVQSVVITVDPEPVLNLTNAVICSHEAANYEIKLAPANLPVGTNFTWAAPTMSDLSTQGNAGTSIPMGVAGTIHINDIFINTTTAPITATYTISAQSGAGCNSTQAVAARQVQFTINPRPVGGADVTPIVCSNASVNYNLTNNIATLGNNLITGTTFSWVAAANAFVSGESTAAQSSATISDVLRNVTTSNQTVVYSVTPTSSAGCVGIPFSVSVTVRPEPQGFDDATDACSDVAVGYDLLGNIANTGAGGNNLVTGTTFSWVAAANAFVAGESAIPQNGATITDALTNVTTTNQTVIYTVTPTSVAGCNGTPFTVTVTVRPEPRGFTDTPPAACSNAPLAYDLAANISNTGAGGNNVTVGTTFSWVASDNTNTTGESLAPQSGPVINNTIRNFTTTNQIVVYTVTPTSADGCVGNSFDVSFTVRPEPRGFNDAEASCSDAAINYDLSLNIGDTGAGGNNLVTGTTYSWVATSNTNVTGESTLPQTGSVITDVLNNVTTVNRDVVYTVTPASATGCVGATFTVTITVRPEPRGFNDNTPIICSDAVVNYNLLGNIADTGSGGNNLTGGTTFSWVAAANANVTGESTTLQAGSTINDPLNNVTNSNQVVVYTVTPTSADGCAGNTFTVSVTVRPEPRGFDDATPIVCSDATVNYNLTNNVANVGNGGNNLLAGTTFSWIAASNANVSGESFLAPASGATINDVLNNVTNSNQIVIYTVTPRSSDGCFGNTFTVSVTVRPEPKGFNDNAITCSDVALAYDLELNIANTGSGGNNLVSGTTYSWTSAPNANVTGESSGSSSVINDVLNNVTSSSQIVVYTVTPTSGNGCVGNSFTVSVTVRPEPRGFNDNTPVICSDAIVNYDLLGNIGNTVSGGNNLVTGTTFSWIAANNANVTGESFGAPVVSTGISDVLNNVTNSDQVVVYTVTPLSVDGCSGNTFAVSVTVRPEPRGFDDTTPVICSDASVNYNLALNVANLGSGGNNLVTGTTFSWIATANANVTGESAVTPVTSLSITDVLNNVTDVNQVVVYTVTPTSTNGCVGNTFQVSVTVQPEPKGFNDNSPVICSDDNVNYILANNIANTVSGGNNLTTGTTYTWVAATNGNVTGESVTPQPGGTISDLLNNVTNVNQVVVYTVTPTSSNACVGNTFTVSVTVRPEPRGFNDASPVICSDAAVNYDLVANVNNTGAGGNALTTGSTFSWIATPHPLVSGETSGAPVNSAMINDVLANVSGVNQVVVYSVTPTSGDGCQGNAFTVSVTVTSKPVGLLDNTENVCSDESINYNIQTRNINILGNSVASAFTYTVVSSDPANVSVAGKNRSIASNAPITDTYTNLTSADVLITYTITPFSTVGTCQGANFDVVVTVHPEPRGPNVTIERCSDVAVNFDLQTVVNTATTGNSVPSLFRYTVSSTNAAAVAPGPNRNIPSSALVTDVYTNFSNADVNIIYTVTGISMADGCEGTPFTVTVTVHPEPVGQSVAVPGCQVSLNHSIQTQITNGLPSVFTYTVASSNAVAVAPEADRVVASAANIVHNYVNVSGSDVTITYTVTPYNAANPTCPGTPFTYAVTISSRPVGAGSTVAAVCSDATFSIDPQVNITNGVVSTFSWTVTFDPGLTGPTSGSGSTITGTLSNNTIGVKNAYFEVTPTSGSCAGDPFTITLPINPEPVIDPSVTPRTICSDTPTNIVFSALAGAEAANLYDITLLSQDADLVGTATTGTGLGANAIEFNSFTNKLRTQGLLVRYEVTPFGAAGIGGCEGDKLVVQIEVLPEPVMLPTLSNVSICSDVANGIELDSDGISITATNYFINSVNVQSTGTAIAPNTTVAHLTSALSNILPDPSTVSGARSKSFIRNDKFTVTTADAADNNNTVVYNVTPRSGAGCYGDAFNINLLILPEPRFDPVAPPPVCSDDAVDLQLIQRDPTSPLITQYNVAGITFQAGLVAGGSNILIGQVLPADVNGDYISITDKYINPTATTLNATYSIKPIAAAVLGHTCEGDVENAVVIIRPSPVVIQNLDKIVCNDAVNGITLGTEATSAAAQSYLIVRNAPAAGLGGGNYVVGTSRVDGATTGLIGGDHLVNSQNTTRQVTYSITAYTDPGADLGIGCPGPTETITVTVEPQILVTLSNPSTGDICSGDETAIALSTPSTPSSGNVTFNFTASAAMPGTVSGILPGSNFTSADPIEQILSNSSNNAVDVTYLVTPRANSAAGGNGCIGTPSTTTVKVEPKPRMTVLPASLTVCEGVPLGIDFASPTVPSSGAASMFFHLISVEDPNSLGPPVNVSGFATLGTHYPAGTNVLNDNLTNASLGQESVRYHFTPSFTIPSKVCEGDDVSINVTVSPRPVLLPFTVDPVCSGEAFSVNFLPSVTQADPGSTLTTWTFAYPAGGNFTGASNGAGYDLSQVIFNKNAAAGTVTYSIKARSFNCESNTITVPVQVTPTPKMTGVPNSVNVCDDGTMNVVLNSNASNTLYTWEVDDESQPTLTGANDQATAVSGPINYLLSNSSDALGNYTFLITPQVATALAGKVCVGDPVTTVVNVAPPLAGQITTSNGTNESFICTGSRETILFDLKGLQMFDVVYKVGATTVNLTKQSALPQVTVQPTTTTTYELVSIKDAFGCSMNINQTATVNVNTTSADFSVVSPVEACAPHKVSFQYDQQEGVDYTWKWFDGPDSTTYTATVNEPGKIVKHTFDNASPVSVAKYKVYLETKLNDARFPGCAKTTFQEVRVSPNVALSIFADVTEICSGETVTFTNTTQGAGSHRWFFRPLGSTQENEVRTTVATSYQLTNNTAQNPVVIEVVYHADNGKCPGTTTVPITVYRGVEASFDEGTIPPYVAGSATVTFANTSVPLDGNDFTYEWTFGTNSNPSTADGTTPTIPVTYSLPGLKEVTLVATNKVSEAAGKTCSDTFSKTIAILLPPLIAAFQVNPLAACFPVDVAVTSNTSTGDTYKWQVIDQSGNVAATAQAPTPIFRIVNPGTYDIFLETSSSITGQKAFSQINGVEVFDNPVASLEARPTTLFIPDTELTTFNFSTGANFYVWDFDDGNTSEDFEPSHFYTLEGTYNITLVAGFDHGDRDIDGDGFFDGNVVCYDTATRQVIAKEGGLTKVPNAFTPNKDGPTGGVPGNGTFNDTFLPITKGVAREDGAFIMQIFDRWGTLIFESRNQNMGWDGYDRNGNLVPAGVYVYKLDLRLADGQRTTQIGDVTVIR